MNITRQSFSVDDALQYGVTAAIIINRFALGYANSRANQQTRLPDEYGINRQWLQVSTNEVEQWFPYLTKHQIHCTLRQLINKNVLIKQTTEQPHIHHYALVEADQHLASESNCTSPCYSRRPTLSAAKKKQIENERLLHWFEETFWPRYPIKKEKFRAKKAILKLCPNDELQTLVMKGLNNQITERQLKSTTNQWVADWKNPTTWINNRCWEDEVQRVVKEIEANYHQNWQHYYAKNSSLIEMGIVTEAQLYQLWQEAVSQNDNNMVGSRGGRLIEGESL